MVIPSGLEAVADVAAGGWLIFWLSLPALVRAVAVIIVPTVALMRARSMDVPKVCSLYADARCRDPRLDARWVDRSLGFRLNGRSGRNGQFAMRWFDE